MTKNNNNNKNQPQNTFLHVWESLKFSGHPAGNKDLNTTVSEPLLKCICYHILNWFPGT